MKFCEKCDNMYYIGISSENQNQLTYYCRFCGNKDESITEEGICVLDSQLKNNKQKFDHIINPYTKLDPTLPRIFNMKCPNTECKTNHSEHKGPTEVIYIRYDDNNLKYLYICAECDTKWKSDDA